MPLTVTQCSALAQAFREYQPRATDLYAVKKAFESAGATFEIEVNFWVQNTQVKLMVPCAYLLLQLEMDVGRLRAKIEELGGTVE